MWYHPRLLKLSWDELFDALEEGSVWKSPDGNQYRLLDLTWYKRDQSGLTIEWDRLLKLCGVFFGGGENTTKKSALINLLFLEKYAHDETDSFLRSSDVTEEEKTGRYYST